MYLVATGHDVALVSLSAISPQPMGHPVSPVERKYSASSVLHDQGGFVHFHWDFIESEAIYQSLLGQFGLTTESTADVTIWARSERFVWKRYNGIAQLPEPKQDVDWSNFFIRDLNLYVVDLEALVEF